MPNGWEPLAVLVLFSPATLVLGLGLQWLLRHRIANTWVRVLGSMVVAGAVLNVAFFALLNSLASWPG
ncbi:MAG: hypothetical protein ACXVSL_22430 [Solirubrobacteraceae bacterium]